MDSGAGTTWRDVVGWEGLYEVSNTGRVRRVGGKELPLQVRDGYKFAKLSDSPREKTARVHRLVAEAFMGICPAGQVVHPKNADRGDNHLGNLEYGTQSENITASLPPERNGPLAACDVSRMRKLHDNYGVSRKALAELWGVSKTTVQHVVTGKTFKGVA